MAMTLQLIYMTPSSKLRIALGHYCAPNPFSTNCRPSGVSDPIKLSTSWLVVLAEGLKV